MAKRTLDNRGDHDARVRTAELGVRLADMIRGDFMAFKAALTSLEGYLQDFWRILNLDPAIKESLCVMLMEKRNQCEVISLLFDNIVSRYDRFLNLVPCLHVYSSGCLIKPITAVELHQYPDDRRDEECLRAKCGGHKEDGRASRAKCAPGTIDGCHRIRHQA